MPKHNEKKPEKRKNDPPPPALQVCPKGHQFQAGVIPRTYHKRMSPQCYK
jgi:hypothetical protein